MKKNYRFIELILIVFIFTQGFIYAEGWVPDVSSFKKKTVNTIKSKTRSASKYINKATRNTSKYINSATRKTSTYVNRAKQSAATVYNNKTRKYISTAERHINSFSKKYGTKAARELKKVSSKYGYASMQKVETVAWKYGKKASTQVSYAYNKWGKSAGDNLANTYKKLGSKAANVYMKIYTHEGKRVADRMSKWGISAQNRFIQMYKAHGRNAMQNIMSVYEQCGRSLGANTAWACSRVLKVVKNPSYQERAINATVKTAKLIHKIKSTAKGYAADSIRATCKVVEIPDGKGGKINLEGYCRNWIRGNAPFIKGTTIEQDPIGAFTYVVVFNDTGYVTSDMRIIKDDDGNYVSMKDAIVESSPFDTGTSMKAIECAEAFETLTDDSADEEDIIVASNLIQTINAE